jgi:inner membrane protein
MDNLTHTLTGALLAQTRLREWTPYATTTLVIGANLPDVDIVSRLVGGKAAYLQYHRGVSHAVAGVVLLALALAAAIWLANQLRRKENRRAVPFGRLCAISLLGLATHPLLDFTNSYGIRPFLPMIGDWVYGDLVFIVDPLLWLILGGALFLLTSRSRGQLLTWGSVAVVLSLAIVVTPMSGSGMKSIWLIALVVLVGIRRHVRALPQSLATSALIAVVAYWGLRGLGHEIAMTRLSRYVQESFSGETRLRTAVLPTPDSPFLWRAIVETDTTVYTFDDLTILGDLKGGLQTYRRARALNDPYVQRALATPAGEVMLAFARFPITRVVDRGDQVEVVLSDARFARGDDMGWCALTVSLPRQAKTPATSPASRTPAGRYGGD